MVASLIGRGRGRPALVYFRLEFRCCVGTAGLFTERDEGGQQLTARRFGFQVEIIRIAQAGLVVTLFQVELAKPVQRFCSSLAFDAGVKIDMPTGGSRESHRFGVLDASLRQRREPLGGFGIFPGLEKRYRARPSLLRIEYYINTNAGLLDDADQIKVVAAIGFEASGGLKAANFASRS